MQLCRVAYQHSLHAFWFQQASNFTRPPAPNQPFLRRLKKKHLCFRVSAWESSVSHCLHKLILQSRILQPSAENASLASSLKLKLSATKPWLADFEADEADCIDINVKICQNSWQFMVHRSGCRTWGALDSILPAKQSAHPYSMEDTYTTVLYDPDSEPHHNLRHLCHKTARLAVPVRPKTIATKKFHRPTSDYILFKKNECEWLRLLCQGVRRECVG